MRSVKAQTKTPDYFGMPSQVTAEFSRNLMQPSVSFSSQGRNEKTVARENRNIDFFLKKEDKLQCLSSLAYREKTLREKGVQLKYEQDFLKFNSVVEKEKDALDRLTVPTFKDPKNYDACISPKEKKLIMNNKVHAREEFHTIKEERHDI